MQAAPPGPARTPPRSEPRARRAAWAIALALVLLAGCGSSAPGRPLAAGIARTAPVPAGSRVITIVLENADYGQVIGSPDAPYTNALAHRYGLATQSYAVTHPSLPNYLALTSGSTHGIESDCTACSVRATNIVDQLEAAHVPWGAYLEDVPRPCYTGAQAGGYAKKHNPFAYYEDVVRSPDRCARLAGFGALAAALRDGRLPRYTWITPNLCDDGHDCGVRAADRFLARTVPLLLSRLGPHGFIVLTWDEGVTGAGCCGGASGGRVATVIAGPTVRRGARESRPLDHYGVLATVERALGLPRLGAAASPEAGSLAQLFAGGRVPAIR